MCDGENKIWMELCRLGAGQSAGMRVRGGGEGVTPRVKATLSPHPTHHLTRLSPVLDRTACSNHVSGGTKQSFV